MMCDPLYQPKPYPLPLFLDGYYALYLWEGTHPEKLSHRLLLSALEQYTGRTYVEEDIVRKPNEKPYLRDHSVFFSVTHSGDIWLVCISAVPVGLDVQQHKDRYSPGVAGRYFHPDEVSLLEKAKEMGNDIPLFFRLWSARESYAKYTGAGIAGMEKDWSVLRSPVPIWEIPFRDGVSLYLCSTLPNEKI